MRGSTATGTQVRIMAEVSSSFKTQVCWRKGEREGVQGQRGGERGKQGRGRDRGKEDGREEGMKE